MNPSQIYIVVAIVIVAVVFFLVFRLRRSGGENRLTPLAGLAFVFVVAGLIFGNVEPVGYGLMTVGVVLALVDLARRKQAP